MIKFRPLILSIIGGVFVVMAVALWIFRYQLYVTKNDSASEYPSSENPEFFLDQALTTIYRDNGKIAYQFNAEYLENFKKSNITQAKMVYFIFYGQDGLTWHASANKATFLNEKNKIRLNDNVRIWQPTRHLELTTDEVFFDEEREYAETDKPVTIKSPVGVTNSVGMNVDLNQEKLQLLSAVKGLYHVK